MDYSPENLRERYKQLEHQRAKINDRLDPLRTELDAIVAGDTKLTIKQAKARENEIRPQIVKLQGDLFPIDQERAVIARALNGKITT